ncbi:MAG: DUF4760 domain-containing protein [Candidatus Thorarchaeota archaeon]|jgi:hypothetical protein
MVDLQTLSVILAALSIVIASTYYISTLRNTRQTRQAQLFMQIYQNFTSTEFNRTQLELMKYEWENYEDFERKYGSDNNVDSYAKRNSHLLWYNGVGLLLQKKLIDPEMVYFTAGNQALWHWAKFGPVIKEIGRRYNVQDALLHFEYLIDEMMKISDKRGETLDYIPLGHIPETFTSHVPEE